MQKVVSEPRLNKHEQPVQVTAEMRIEQIVGHNQGRLSDVFAGWPGRQKDQVNSRLQPARHGSE